MMAASSSPPSAGQVDFGLLTLLSGCQADNGITTLSVCQADNGLSVVKSIMESQ